MGILNWIKVVLFSLLGILLVTVKVLLGRNSALKEKLEKKEAHLRLKIDQQNIKDEVVDREKDRVEELKDSNGTSRSDRLNGVLNPRDP